MAQINLVLINYNNYMYVKYCVRTLITIKIKSANTVHNIVATIRNSFLSICMCMR